MLGSTPITAVLGAAPPADAETARLKAYAKAATGIGLALLLIAPGSKVPVDMRSPAQKRKDDAAAQDAARAAGRVDYMKARSLAGAHLATTDDTLIGRYITKYRKVYGEDAPVNFAIEVGRSNLVVVDCDTADQVRAFLTDAGVADALPPTVRTPGALDPETGQWAHRDGGHFYFTVDKAQYPSLDTTGTGSYVADGGYAVMWRDRYILIPPSVRPEGTYQLAGREYPVVSWIIDAITTRTAARRHHAESVDPVDGEMAAAIDAWSLTVGWADILAPLGWCPTARPDRCGCDIWTAPGVHSSPKSATAHDTGCDLGRYTESNAPLHIWTDNPGEPFQTWVRERGTQTLSKLQAVALTSYGGDVGAACTALGIIPDKSLGMDGLGFDRTSVERSEGVDAGNLDEPLDPTVQAANDTAALVESAREWHAQRGMPYDPDTVMDDPSEDEPIPEVLTVNSGGDDVHVVAVRPGDRFTPHHSAMLGAQGFRGEWTKRGETAADGYLYTFTGPETDGRIVAFLVGPDQVIESIVIDNVPYGAVTLTALPSMIPDSPREEFPADATPPPSGEAVLISDDSAMPTIAPFDYWRNLPPVEYAVEGLIEHRALTSIIGPPGVGKSTVAIDIACSMVTGIRWQGRKTIRQRVLYLPGEGLSGARDRLVAWEQAHGLNVGQDLLMGDAIIQLAAAKEHWQKLAAYVLRHRVGLIIFDTFARMSLGLEENSATDVGKAITRFDQIRKLTGAGVMVLHHTAKNSIIGRGSSALNGALDTELLILDGSWDASGVDGDPVDLYTSKQKNAPRLREPLPLLLAPAHDSVIVTGPSGVVGDPLDAAASVPLRVPEPIVETAIRLYDYAQRFPAQGCTRGEFVTGVIPDEYTASQSNTDVRWKRVVAEAVDLGLRYGLLQTLTGSPSGSRYITAGTTPDAARLRAAQEAVTD